VTTVPARKAVWLAAVPAVLSLTVLAVGGGFYAILLLDAVVVAALVADYRTLPRKSCLSVERDLQHTFALSRSYPVAVVLLNRLDRELALEVNDDLPEAGEVQDLPCAVRLAPRSRVALEYRLALHARGRHRLERVYVRGGSRLGFWQRILTYEVAATVTVYPDVKQVTDYLTLARRHQVSLLGIRRLGQAGGDSEFERLKEYHTDDEFRHIAWKATAKQNRLISKAFQVNENQSVTFMLDCGRMMLGRVGDVDVMDYALNAVLMLGCVAVKNHDNVGLLTFSDHVESYLPPKGGPGQMKRLIHAVHDRSAKEAASNFREAFGYLSRHWRRRALLVLITQAIDDVTFGGLKREILPLRTRRLPLLVLLRDRGVTDMVEAEPKSEKSLYRSAAAAEFLGWRRRHVEDLRRQGILCLDVHPEELTAKLVNEYLRIKARHLL